jgi:hypothetical protein
MTNSSKEGQAEYERSLSLSLDHNNVRTSEPNHCCLQVLMILGFMQTPQKLFRLTIMNADYNCRAAAFQVVTC